MTFIRWESASEKIGFAVKKEEKKAIICLIEACGRLRSALRG
jgi:hypothetical protein